MAYKLVLAVATAVLFGLGLVRITAEPIPLIEDGAITECTEKVAKGANDDIIWRTTESSDKVYHIDNRSKSERPWKRPKRSTENLIPRRIRNVIGRKQHVNYARQKPQKLKAKYPYETTANNNGTQNKKCGNYEVSSHLTLPIAIDHTWH